MSAVPDSPENEEVQFLYTDEVSEDLALDDASDFEQDESESAFAAYDDELLDDDWQDGDFADGESDAIKF